MTQTEWIVSLDDDLNDGDELFVGNVRDGDIEQISRFCSKTRCPNKNCIHHVKHAPSRAYGKKGKWIFVDAEEFKECKERK